MKLQLTTYTRKIFTVKAAEVTFKNVEDIAKWCNGTVDTETTRILGGAEAELPVVKLQGQGEDKGKELVARLGYFVVESRGRFRVYKAPQFHASFDLLEQKDELNEIETSFAEAIEQVEEDNSSVDGQETVMVDLGGQNLL